MTPPQIIVVTCLYFVVLLIVIYFTRANARRIVGAFAGGAAVGLFGMGAIFFGNAVGLWRGADCLDAVLPGAVLRWVDHYGHANLSRYLAGGPPIRTAWYGGLPGVVAIIGSPRDYLYALKFPEW